MKELEPTQDSLLAEFKLTEDPTRAKDLGFRGAFWQVEHDFVLAPERK
ncbi:hypothetical protein Rhsp01_16890 [Rhizobium sp. NBRC 114257]|uniref:Uncharacterized protein n=1 Tax=Rhizobium dioscoreae TaxID=2653122 RepID=A0ABQ0Z0Q9_9HYPH|nr:hypothetical protein RsS93_16840 [Rhizobium dioscoreae]GLU80513.1 hypothetical protein Rhsp01_16890 [Rhizobium sp. NBRC 114257]